MHRLLFLGLVASFVLIGAACGDDDDSGSDDVTTEEQEAIDALSEGGFTSRADLSDDELLCVARSVVEDESLFDSLASDEDFETLDIDQQVAVVDIGVDCAPDAMVAVMAESMTADGDITAEQAECFGRGIIDDDELVRASLAMASGGEITNDFALRMFDLIESCDIPLDSFG